MGMRVKIEASAKDNKGQTFNKALSYSATIIKNWQSGYIDANRLSKVQEKKLLNYGYVYININPLYIY